MTGISAAAAALLDSWFPNLPHPARWPRVKRRAQQVSHVGTTDADGELATDQRVRYGELDPKVPAVCGDCGVAVGEVHVPGCARERCPRCHGQLISCGGFGGCDLGRSGLFLVPEVAR